MSETFCEECGREIRAGNTCDACADALPDAEVFKHFTPPPAVHDGYTVRDIVGDWQVIERGLAGGALGLDMGNGEFEVCHKDQAYHGGVQVADLDAGKRLAAALDADAIV